MKQLVARFILAGICSVLTACPFANQIGYRPQGGIKGAEVKDRIKFEVLAAYSLSFFAFCNEVFNDDECRDGNATQASKGGLAASLLAAELAPVEDDQYYTESSVEDCARGVSTAVGAIALLHMNSKKSCSSLIVTNCVIAGGEVIQAGVLAGLTAPSYCDVEKTGRILSFHQYNL